ncbi:SCUBE3 [Branchiostoma lanceolatum]|uniref:SCUBE3 protein n=1 Tax=Branchiostoma lanceolatum TaxID=7740 RepID=A0A8J9W1S9_BRALA|nr:SCUBE3 [Branchiostoma lanceolatum]
MRSSIISVFLLLVLILCPDGSQSWRRRRCNVVHCQWAHWSSWSTCTASCGPYGTQDRTRGTWIINECGGNACSGSNRETRACNRWCYNSGSVSGGSCGCSSGYTGTCCGNDIDECRSGNGGCDHTQTCYNTEGSFHCGCRSGYQPSGSRTCADINECSSGNGGCSDTCHNTQGSFYCSCRSGYRLSGSRRCVDIDECRSGNGGCDHTQTCYNTEGSFHCGCRSGYQPSGSRTCADINECSSGNGGCSDTCHNTQGSFYCSCRSGYRLSGSRRCVDIDECASNNGGCRRSDICTNTDGSFYCSCKYVPGTWSTWNCVVYTPLFLGIVCGGVPGLILLFVIACCIHCRCCNNKMVLPEPLHRACDERGMLAMGYLRFSLGEYET